jgi:hypothetical protein
MTGASNKQPTYATTCSGDRDFIHDLFCIDGESQALTDHLDLDPSVMLPKITTLLLGIIMPAAAPMVIHHHIIL